MGCGGSKAEPESGAEPLPEATAGRPPVPQTQTHTLLEPAIASMAVPTAQAQPVVMMASPVVPMAQPMSLQMGMPVAQEVDEQALIAQAKIREAEARIREAEQRARQAEAALRVQEAEMKAKAAEHALAQQTRMAALEKALRDAMPGWFGVWTERSMATLERAIAQAEAAFPLEGSTLQAALLEAKAALHSQAEAKAQKEAEARRKAETNAAHPSVQTESASAMPQPQGGFCATCGGPMAPGAKFCGKCGTKAFVVKEVDERARREAEAKA